MYRRSAQGTLGHVSIQIAKESKRRTGIRFSAMYEHSVESPPLQRSLNGQSERQGIFLIGSAERLACMVVVIPIQVRASVSWPGPYHFQHSVYLWNRQRSRTTEKISARSAGSRSTCGIMSAVASALCCSSGTRHYGPMVHVFQTSAFISALWPEA